MFERELFAVVLVGVVAAACGRTTLPGSSSETQGAGGTGSDASRDGASGGTSNGGSASVVGSSGAGGEGDVCRELSDDARNAFEDGYLPEHRVCAVDSDCVLVPGASCVGWCGYFVNQSSVAGLDDAIAEYCAAFEAEGCVVRSFPCLTATTPHLPVTCEAGLCTPTPRG